MIIPTGQWGYWGGDSAGLIFCVQNNMGQNGTGYGKRFFLPAVVGMTREWQ